MSLFTHQHTFDSQLIYSGHIISLRVDRLKNDTGDEALRESIEHNGGVVIAGLSAAKEIILIKQYRYSIDRELIELPAGRIEKGENPLPAAERELIEETGYEAQSWEEKARFYSAPGFCNEILYLFEATQLTFIGKNLDVDEETEVLITPLQKAWEMVLSGEICDAKTVASLGLLVNQHL